MWIPSPELAIVRIKDCVAQGGHNIPTEDVRRRFKRSTENFFKQYRILADKWILFNNAQTQPKIIAKKQNTHVDIINRDLYELISKTSGVTL